MAAVSKSASSLRSLPQLLLNLQFNKFEKKKKGSRKQSSSGNSETKATPKRVLIRPTHKMPPSLSRDRRIKMKKSINQKVNDVTEGVELLVP